MRNSVPFGDGVALFSLRLGSLAGAVSQVVGLASQVRVFGRDLRRKTATGSVQRRRLPTFSGTCDKKSQDLRRCQKQESGGRGHGIAGTGSDGRPQLEEEAEAEGQGESGRVRGVVVLHRAGAGEVPGEAGLDEEGAVLEKP